MASLDLREKGYRRERVPLEKLVLMPSDRNGQCDCTNSQHGGCCNRKAVRHLARWLERRGLPEPPPTMSIRSLAMRLSRWLGLADEPRSTSPPRVWIYLAEEVSRHPASAEFPMCQTYIDVVMNGCIDWGGAEMAREFITSTIGWSPFWLNDVPQSRRPWLHRRSTWRVIDELLESYEA